jgi:pimeloyl-ACP methyl ester carboxylesterase
MILRGGLSALALAAVAVLSGCGAGNAAEAPPAAAAPAAQVTAVLVHGAWADGSSWSRVIPLLQQRGLNVVAVQLQRASLAEDAAIVRRAVAAQAGPVVLVGHSYGGAVISEAGDDARVAALVYVSAFAPGEGESINDLVSPYPAGAWQAGLTPDTAGYLSLGSAAFQAYFAADLPRAEAAVLAATQAPIFNHVLQDKLSHAAWRVKPSYWVLSANDQIIPAAFQQGEAARIKAKVTRIDSGHTGLLSHPQEVAAVIAGAAPAPQP